MPRYRFRDVRRIGPVQVGTFTDRHGREAHATACTAPGCDWSAEYLSAAAAELAAQSHRCNAR
ncbi:Mobile element transfer [Streptomyces cellostaticus]|uniref:Mobile element transfer n=1 Tax=Streptomyces cellostaticus TaxID=67285 RepID=A0A117PV43_9ACTN|nr:mobile element transfer protein [Streptomyces cellostaticus]KUM93108.1 Mobile element transfer [Streptomyces cellostaticus]GHI06147.1 SpdB2 protein [Streptomyces cellostaticus]